MRVKEATGTGPRKDWASELPKLTARIWLVAWVAAR
jgi:hypothetical protein